uniref:Ras-GEF domain-containing protein n=1 Tax=Parastrongyloides trichosuri TaxID=131310 RepID=A0A0N4Z7Y5_PARTI
MNSKKDEDAKFDTRNISLDEYVLILASEPNEHRYPAIKEYLKMKHSTAEKLNNIEFSKWFSTIIWKMINIVDSYKRDNECYTYDYEAEQNMKNVFSLNSMKINDLEKALRFLYFRIFNLYLLRFSEWIDYANYKKILILLTNEVMNDLLKLTNEMDEKCIKILYMLDKYDEINNSSNKSSNEHVYLRELLKAPDYFFKGMIYAPGEIFIMEFIMGQNFFTKEKEIIPSSSSCYP